MGAHGPGRRAAPGGLTDAAAGAAGPRRTLYGRRHGKKLRASQQRLLAELLPRLRILGVDPQENPRRLPLSREALFADGRPLEYVKSVMRADRYKIVLDLVRQPMGL